MSSIVESQARRVGEEHGVSGWITIEQHRIDASVDCTGDRQRIHFDVERARRERLARQDPASGNGMVRPCSCPVSK
jgi:acyl dehydratase